MLQFKRFRSDAQAVLEKRNRGNIGDIIGTALCMLTFLTIFILSVHYIKMLDTKRDIDAIARQNLLLLEEQGDLSPTQIDDIRATLTRMGFHDYDIIVNDDVNNATHVSYGNNVSIEIKVRTNPKELGITKVYGFVRDTIPFSTKLQSISKAGVN